MARPLKTGLDYFPFDTDFFENLKMKRLRAAHGIKGLIVYIYCLCQIYKNGYWVECGTDDLIFSASEDLHLSEDVIREILSYLLSRGLFDPSVAERDKVLTSKSIQLRYAAATERRQSKIGKYNLLEKNDFEEAVRSIPSEKVSVTETGVSVDNNPLLMQAISTQSKVKESKVNQSKVDESKVDQSKIKKMKLNESRPDQTKTDENKINDIRPDQSQREENDMESIASAISGAMTGLSGLAEKNNFHFSADKADYPEDEVNYPHPFRF